MFNNQAISVTAKDNDRMEERHLNNERNEHKFFVNVSPHNESRCFLKRAYTSPRILSKSVPRKNKSFIRYRINRSLSFDNTKNDCSFKSPNSSSGSSSFDSDKQLTRSAKIMRALNFNCSPFYNQRKKIKKTLNFNLTPSPKKFSNLKSPRDSTNLNLTTSSPKINKTLNFDTSLSNSSTSSILLTSFESTDENQNQTPSQRNTKAKKLLNYVTPKRRMYVSSPDMDISSPSLRRSLKEKIDDIVQMSSSPTTHSFNRGRQLLNVSTRCNISTPRNLYTDFSDEDNERPCTPENTFSIVPESMSAIKKSHKKERSLRQMDNLSRKQANALTDPFVVEQFDDLQTEKRPLTPPTTEKNVVSVCDTSSIKQSHKKDKNQGSAKDEENRHYPDVSLDKSENNMLYETDSNNLLGHNTEYCEVTNNSGETKDRKVISNVTNIVDSNSSSLEEQTHNAISKNPLPSISNTNEDTEIRPVTPNAVTVERNSTTFVGVTTPENRIHFLQRIQTESIKKSHKKVKDENKKKLFLPKSLDHKLEVEKLSIDNHKHPEVLKDNENDDHISVGENCSDAPNINRAGTPENINSSRLLLSNFSSVKKSHKKDKHNKIVSEFMRRQKYLNRSVDCNNAQHEVQNSSKKKIQQEIITKSLRSNGSIPNSHADDIISYNRMSPSKRKIFSNLLDDDLSHLLCNSESIPNECETTEEFKIFTPIKRRKSLLRTNLKSDCLHDLQSDKNDSFEEEIINIDTSRCITPTLRHIGCAALPDNKTDLLEKVKDSETVDNEKNNSIVKQQQSDTQDQNGRSTPTNMSTMELLPNINSIKKSHRKDKRGNGLHRGLIVEQEKLFLEKSHHECLQNDHSTSTTFSKLNNNKQNLGGSNIATANKLNSAKTETQSSPITIHKDSQNSDQDIGIEDRRSIQTNDTTSSSKTPPNCLLTKSYIRLLQATSIKKSHKKERDRKRHKLVSQNYDSELSDDGSIFGENEKIDSLENSNAIIKNNKKGFNDCNRRVLNCLVAIFQVWTYTCLCSIKHVI
ncbi:hypothetical protein KPH14_012332 [Odynerus spinipes]|uniref:Uncharacterized protein n=1 Tax=Odynerus spinipes TaxID=1348599 RepID=A0AAD9RI41_9HYME|nr:hypothetical protein KPH14_012332 [Odynerus spinipes]